jgi:aryl-alcohol dehydrogenase-like predicted oxidoreductase
VAVEEAYEMLKLAYINGVNFFDNAEAYGGGGVRSVVALAVAAGGC